MAKADLTAQRLREVLQYEPTTGLFVWLVTNSRRRMAGAGAGCVRHGGYIAIRVDGELYPAHRLAWLYVYGEWPTKEIDHIDGDASNNRISNLRDVSRRTNAENKRRARSDNKFSGLLGAHWCAQQKTWKATIRVNGRTRHIGVFKTPEEAHAAYLDAKRALHLGCTI